MELSNIFNYEFVQRAFLAGILIAAVSSILGVFLVLRRFSLIGDGLAHVTFGSVAVVMLIGVSPMYITLAALPLVMISSLAILKLTSSKRIQGDAAIGIVSSIGIATGIILASLSGGYNLDLFSYLFGNILTVTQAELLLSLIVFLVVVATVIIFYDDLLAITFDEELARTMGIKTKRINIDSFFAYCGCRGFSHENRRHHARFRNADSASADRFATFLEFQNDNYFFCIIFNFISSIRIIVGFFVEFTGRRNYSDDQYRFPFTCLWS